MEDAFVLDSSVTMSWFLNDEYSEIACKLRDSLSKKQAHVPSLWSIEIANVFCQSEKKGRITPYESASCINLLKKLPINVDTKTTDYALSRILELAREYKLTVYNACYLELSLRFTCPLATFDKELRIAAKKAGIPVLPIRL